MARGEILRAEIRAPDGTVLVGDCSGRLRQGARPAPSAIVDASPAVSPAPQPGPQASPAVNGAGSVVAAGPTPPHGSTGSGAVPATGPRRPPDTFTVPETQGGVPALSRDAAPASLATGSVWLVPSLAPSVPGVVLVLAVTAQALGGLLWIPIVRRRLAGPRGSGPRSANGH